MGGAASVLVVDDDPDIRDCMADVLESAGYDVRTAANGKEGLEALGHGYRPCVVLLDLMMPVMTGQEFLAEVRRGELSELPVVVVTAAGQSVVAPGADELMRKPFDIDKLLAAVERHCAAVQPALTSSSQPG